MERLAFTRVRFLAGGTFTFESMETVQRVSPGSRQGACNIHSKGSSISYNMDMAIDLPPIAPDPVIDAYKPGVDVTLLRKNLKLTVDQRFEQLKEMQRLYYELRSSGKKAFGVNVIESDVGETR